MSRRSRRRLETLTDRLVDSKIDGLALLGVSAAIAMVPGAREALDDRLRCEQAALKIAAIVGAPLAAQYIAEAERRWAFAAELNRTTLTGGRRKADVFEAFVVEVQAGIV